MQANPVNQKEKGKLAVGPNRREREGERTAAPSTTKEARN